jgi:hypothetical protein
MNSKTLPCPGAAGTSDVDVPGCLGRPREGALALIMTWRFSSRNMRSTRFRYPGHGCLRFLHWPHVGCIWSHLTLRSRQVEQPFEGMPQYTMAKMSGRVLLELDDAYCHRTEPCGWDLQKVDSWPQPGRYHAMNGAILNRCLVRMDSIELVVRASSLSRFDHRSIKKVERRETRARREGVGT